MKACTYCTSDTCPYFPDPSYLIFLKSFAETVRFLPTDTLLQISLLPVELPSNLVVGAEWSFYSFCRPLRCLKNWFSKSFGSRNLFWMPGLSLGGSLVVLYS